LKLSRNGKSGVPSTLVDDAIASYPEPQRAIVIALRALIREAAPQLDESVKWGKPFYGQRQ
jgi:hypothetical protein